MAEPTDAKEVDSVLTATSEANQDTEYPLGQDPRRWKILAVLLVSIFTSLISVSIVNVALPSIQHGLDASSSDVQWVLSGYALTFGVILVAAGRAGDLLGRGGIYLIGVVIYTLSCLVAGFAPNAESLNASRFVQGVGAGLLSPQGVGMIQQFFHGKERGRAFGYFGSVVGVAVAIGPVLGGFLIRLGGDFWGWRLTMLVMVPFGILSLILGLKWFPRPLISSVKDPETGKRLSLGKAITSLDPVGSLLLGLVVLAMLFPFVESEGNAMLWALIPVAIVLLAIWVWWEQHVKRTKRYAPMVDLAIFKHASFRNGTLLAGMYFMGMTSIWVLVALYFQEGLGYSALVAGSVGILGALGSSIASNVAGKRVSDAGRTVVVIGILLAMFGVGTSILVIWLQHDFGLSEWWLVLTLAFLGTGQGAVISPNQTLTLADVPLQYAGSSGAVLQTAQRIGTSIGLALITALVFALAQTTNWELAVGTGFAVIFAIVALSLGIAIYDMRVRSHAKKRELAAVKPA